MLCGPLIGREAERQMLVAAAARAAGGCGGVLALTGEQGVGKSRLLREAALIGRSGRMAVVNGRAVASARAVGFRPLTDALLGYFRDAPPPEFPLLAAFRGALSQVVPIWGPEQAVVPASPVVVAEALLRVLAATGRGRGMILTIDDVHWADPETLAVLEYFADHLPSVEVLCVVAARPGESEGCDALLTSLEARRSVQRIEVDRLDEEEVRMMARACLQRDDLLEVERAVVARSGGLPFLVEELASAVGSGVEPQSSLPSSIEDLMARRVAGLGPCAVPLFDAAAVIGMRFDLDFVAAVAEVPLEQALAVVRRAVAQRILAVDPDDRSTLRFRHALHRDAVAVRLLPPQRRALAARALDLLSGVGTGPDEGVAADLAEMAGDATRAAAFLLALGERALASGALATGEAALERGRALVAGVDVEMETQIGLALVRLLVRRGDVRRSGEVGREVLASPVLPPERRVEVHLELAKVAIIGAGWDDAHQHLARACEVPAPISRAVQAGVDAVGAALALALGETEAAQHRAAAVLTVDSGEAPAAVCQALHVLGRLARGRDLDEARALFARAATIAARQGLVAENVDAAFQLGTIDLLALGPADRLLEARELAQQGGVLATVVEADLQLAWWWEDRGAAEDMERSARAARELAQGLGMRLAAAMASTAEAAAAAHRGDESGLERALVAALEDGGSDPDVVAAAHGHARAMLALVRDDRRGARNELEAAATALLSAGRSTPMPMWGLRALLAAVEGVEAERAIGEAAAAEVHVLVAAYLDLARAVVAGRASERSLAEACFAAGDGRLAGLGWLRGLARRHVAEAALRDGWGDPASWLVEALPWVDHSEAVSASVRSLLDPALKGQGRRRRRSLPEPLASFGLTPREVEVLARLAVGDSTREIAERLSVSPKTVERHVENLVTKTGTGSRRRLVVLAVAHAALLGQEMGDSLMP